jgi:hypothetical protein
MKVYLPAGDDILLHQVYGTKLASFYGKGEKEMVAKRAQATEESTEDRASDQIVGEIIKTNMFSETELRQLSSFDDALELARVAHGTLIDAAKEIGDGFALLKDEDKRRLVGVPMILLEWSFYDGDYGAKFVAIRLVTRNPDGGASKYIINDGSTGICEMLAGYQNRTGRTGGLVCRNGLRSSEYTYCVECQRVVNPSEDTGHSKDHKAATTYYIETSA